MQTITEAQIMLANPMIWPGLIGRDPVKSLQLDDVIEAVCAEFNTTKERIIQKSRERHIVVPRQICMYLMRLKLHNIGLKQIGKAFNFDHTTVIHSIQTVKNLIDTDPVYAERIKRIKQKLQ